MGFIQKIFISEFDLKRSLKKDWFYYLFFFGFAVENVTFGMLPVQSFSLTLALSPIICIQKFKEIDFKDNNLRILIFLLGYGSILFLFNYYDRSNFFPLIRQSISFCCGIALYVSCHLLLKKLAFEKLVKLVCLSSCPVLVLGIIQRILDFKTINNSRITVFFTEPSHYGDYLVLIVLPFFVLNIANEIKVNNKISLFSVTGLSLFVVNLILVQSGTALLKVISLALISFVFVRGYFRLKLLVVFFISLVLVAAYLLPGSYIKYLVDYSLGFISNPEFFLKNHTFYDRFYPLYGVVKFLVHEKNIWGVGLGADFFEWKEIYLPQHYEPQLLMKPHGTYLNSMGSKTVLYFGFIGFFLFSYFSFAILKLSDSFVKIVGLNVFLTALWGIGSFASPYLWLCLALTKFRTSKVSYEK